MLESKKGGGGGVVEEEVEGSREKGRNFLGKK